MATTEMRSEIEERLALARTNYDAAVSRQAGGEEVPAAELKTLRDLVAETEQEARTWSDVQQEAQRQGRERREREDLAKRTAARERVGLLGDELIALGAAMDEHLQSLGAGVKQAQALVIRMQRETAAGNPEIDWRRRVAPSVEPVLTEVRLSCAVMVPTGGPSPQWLSRIPVRKAAADVAEKFRQLNPPPQGE